MGLSSNLPASIRQKLKNHADQTGESVFQRVLDRYAIERLLYRISQSDFQDKFLLKGATLFTLWGGGPHRATRDLDLLSFGSNQIPDLVDIFKAIISIPDPTDGLCFDPENIKGALIKEDQEYEGVRIQLLAKLGNIRLPIQIDIGFGDAMVPGPEEADFPTILDLPKPRLRVYPKEVVVAEKYQALVSLGMANSRLKDFYDIWHLANYSDFDGNRLSQAIAATFARRSTPLPSKLPQALTPEFYDDKTKIAQWKAFVKRAAINESDLTLASVIGLLEQFLLPPTVALNSAGSYEATWTAQGPWY
ncbi:hypothetical protein D3C72_258360 [compost metagenome]